MCQDLWNLGGIIIKIENRSLCSNEVHLKIAISEKV